LTYPTCRGLIKSFPAVTILRLVAGTILLVVFAADAAAKICIIALLITVNVMLVSLAIAERREKAENKRRAQKMREQ
jgi:hypothetical protein